MAASRPNIVFAAGGHMNRSKRIGRLGGLIAVVGAVVLAPFVWLCAVAAWLLWRAWWRQAGVRLSALDGPARLYHRADPPATLVSLPPVTAAVLAVLLAGCLWLALRPPRWLLPARHARRFGVGMAVALIAGFVLTTSRQELGDPLEAKGWCSTCSSARSWWS